jgi:hypothetical protein
MASGMLSGMRKKRRDGRETLLSEIGNSEREQDVTHDAGGFLKGANEKFFT